MCDDCSHKNVCRLKTEFESLKKKITDVTPTWATQYYDITIKCKNYSKGVVTPREVANKNLAENYGGV